MADKINCKKFYVDLHDIYYPESIISKIDQVDKLFVKSQYHRSLGEGIPDSKYIIIPNGI